MNIIIENYLPLAKSIVCKFIDRNQSIEDSDIYGCACLALVDASNTYNKEKGAFTTWATRKIKQEIIAFLRKNKKHKKTKNLGEQTFDLHDTFQYKIPSSFLNVLLKDDQKDSSLDKENKKILIDHFINSKSWAEIGRSLNLTRERARQKGQEALKNIQNKNKVLIGDLEFSFFGE